MNANIETMNIEELQAAWEVAYNYFLTVGDDFTKQTLDAIAAAMSAKVAA
jgi:hypothetical protein